MTTNTCGGCTTTWAGVTAAHCANCHQTFGGVRSFDRHRKAGTCHPPETVGLHWNPERSRWVQPYTRTEAQQNLDRDSVGPDGPGPHCHCGWDITDRSMRRRTTSPGCPTHDPV